MTKVPTVDIPSTRDERLARLGTIGNIATATEWERALLVSVDVRLGEVGDNQHSGVSSDTLSPVEFAALGIVGLRSKETVRRYVQAWLDTHDGKYPKPGATRRLPSTEFPRHPNPGNRPAAVAAPTTKNIAAALENEQTRSEILDRIAPAAATAIVSDIADREVGRPKPIPSDDAIPDPSRALRNELTRHGRQAERLAADVRELCSDPDINAAVKSAAVSVRAREMLLLDAINAMYGGLADDIERMTEKWAKS